MIIKEKLIEEGFANKLGRIVRPLEPYLNHKSDMDQFVRLAVNHTESCLLLVQDLAGKFFGTDEYSKVERKILFETQKYVDRALKNAKSINLFQIEQGDLEEVLKHNVFDTWQKDELGVEMIPGKNRRSYTGQTEQAGCNPEYDQIRRNNLSYLIESL